MKPPYFLLTQLLKALSNTTKAFDLISSLASTVRDFYKALSCIKRVHSFDLSGFDTANPDS
jgi:hypothetical protein